MVSKALKDLKVTQVYKDQGASQAQLVHVEKSALQDLKVYRDHKAFQVSKDLKVNPVAKVNVVVPVHVAHAVLQEPVENVVHVAHAVLVFVLL